MAGALDVEPLPGEAKSWARGEAIPSDMPSADVPAGSSAATVDYGKSPESLDSLTRGLANIQRRKIETTGAAYDTLVKNIDRNVANVEEAYKHAGVNKEDFKPWNAEEESKKHTSDPIEAFGSLGSVFGILASAFTGQPFDVAMNASAAAINAIKEGDKREYDRAYKAWQDNTKLALDRHNIQHQHYQDAITLLNTNMAAGEAKLRVAAARFGDEKMLFLLEHGMDKEVMELQASRAKLADGLRESFWKSTLENAKMNELFNLGYDPKNPNSPESTAALKQFQRVYGDKQQPDEQFTRQWWDEHPEGTSEDFSKAFGEFKKGQYARPASGDQMFTQQWWAEHPDGKPEEFAEAYAKFKSGQRSGGAATTLTTDRQIAADVNQIVEKYKQENPNATPEDVAKYRAEQTRVLKAAAAAPTGNKIDELKAKVNRITYMEDTITKVEALLKKHNMITGLGGAITRPAEIVGNVLGRNETDRKQFERYIAELKEWAPRALTDSSGRPLSAEAANVSKIIAGLQMGDTAANTARAYLELRKLLQKMKTDLGSRATGAPTGASSAPAEGPAKKPSWQDAPVVR